jgi:hypothetical protein
MDSTSAKISIAIGDSEVGAQSIRTELLATCPRSIAFMPAKALIDNKKPD